MVSISHHQGSSQNNDSRQGQKDQETMDVLLHSELGIQPSTHEEDRFQMYEK